MAAMEGDELDVYINPDNVEEESLQVLRLVRQHWDQNDIKFQESENGFVNRSFKCYVGDGEDAVMLRVYQKGGYGDALDKSREKQATKVLNEMGICPKVHCIFKNGICFDFVVGRILGWDHLTPLDDVNITKSSVCELARIHSSRARDLALKYGLPEENSFAYLFTTIADLYPETSDWEQSDDLKRIPARELLRSELSACRAVLDGMDLPLVLCHHDPNPTNIIYNQAKGKSTLVDYDGTGFGFAQFDLASFLFTCGLGSNPAGPASPRRQPWYWKDVLSEYLQVKRKLDDEVTGGNDVTEDDVEKLYIQVKKASLVVMMMFVLFYLINASLPKRPFGTRALWIRMSADVYTERYLKEKDGILKMKVPG